MEVPGGEHPPPQVAGRAQEQEEGSLREETPKGLSRRKAEEECQNWRQGQSQHYEGSRVKKSKVQ